MRILHYLYYLALFFAVFILIATFLSSTFGNENSRFLGGFIFLLVALMSVIFKKYRKITKVLDEMEGNCKRMFDNDRNKMRDLLTKSEQRYKSLFHQNTDAVYSFDLDGNFTSANLQGEKCFGYKEEKLTTMSIKDVIVPEQLEKVFQYFEEVKIGTPSEFEIGSINHLGHQIEINVKSFPIYSDIKIVGVYWVVKDITSFKKAQLLLDGQTKILEMIAQALPLKEIFEEIIYLIENLSNGGKCSILVVDETKKKLVLGAAPSLPAEYNEKIDGLEIVPQIGSCGTASILKKTIIVSDIATDPLWHDYKDLALRHKLQACWSSPIVDNQYHLLGTFGLYYEKVCEPTSDEMLLIEKAVYLAKLAILNRKAEETINHMAFHDPLTGLANRRLFKQKIEMTLIDAKNNNIETGLIFLDLDRFKVINDSLGHSVGDLLLQKVANRLKDCMRKQDTIGRQGGDEFIILLENAGKEETAFIAKRIIKALSRPFRLGEHEVVITPSIGISLFPEHGTDPETLIRHADIAMYHAKSEGKNNFQFFQNKQEFETNDLLI